MADTVRRPSDMRVWQFRADKDAPGGYEKRLFPSRADVPADGNWFDSAPEALEGRKSAPVRRPKTPDEMTVQEQVAALEAQSKGKRGKTDNA